MDENDSRRRTVLKGAAAAALVSLAGSSATGARTGTQSQTQSQVTAADHERAAEMLREFYDGYLEGISHAVSTDVHTEASMIEDGVDEPWPLTVWDDPEQARYHGIDLGAGEGGSQPFWDEYQSFDRAFEGEGGSDGEDGDGDGGVDIQLLETNAPVDAGDTLEVTAALESEVEATAAVDLVVGHDPAVVDETSTTVDGTETVTLEFETATVSSSQTFPARVEGATDAAETSVEVIGTDETTSV
ncbi:hypothetical protein GS429_00815 [Natronorubrum sp. JWXQ-INN-674]|uniref:Uncharacterized protein n=1 Tax=Natronorubrum halalkaliphilum TaxID=2691917 RepID=A0A6B0VGL5_9EURY|nr:hypothetical protein [Natronorubrum halalkaliphilum]MXV60634.1 hypothetical protein [Natronorubrum halalkaliphilum]